MQRCGCNVLERFQTGYCLVLPLKGMTIPNIDGCQNFRVWQIDVKRHRWGMDTHAFIRTKAFTARDTNRKVGRLHGKCLNTTQKKKKYESRCFEF